MIEKFTEAELRQIIFELKNNGYDIEERQKAALMHEECEKVFGFDAFVCGEVGGAIFQIADFMTDNYEKMLHQKRRKKIVASDISEEYRRIVSGILEVIKPHLGKTGFTKRC